jgi:hypothetical protein
LKRHSKRQEYGLFTLKKRLNHSKSRALHLPRLLRSAIIRERKRRQRNKRLNLIGEEATAEAQFFSPTRVLAARAFQEGKEAAGQEEIRQKALRKEEAERQRVSAAGKKQEAAL